jgi:U6 snRNA-associated Sm-like protein LSm7
MAKRETVLDCATLTNERVLVCLQGGREVEGVLISYDTLLNLVLDDAVEWLRDPANLTKRSGQKRTLGQTVCRGTVVNTLTPVDGIVIESTSSSSSSSSSSSW